MQLRKETRRLRKEEERTEIHAELEEQLSFATRFRATKQIHIYSRKLSNVGRIGVRQNDSGLSTPRLGEGRGR